MVIADSVDSRTHVTMVVTRELVGGEEVFRLTFVGENGMAQTSSCEAINSRATGPMTAYENAEDKLLKWLRTAMKHSS